MDYPTCSPKSNQRNKKMGSNSKSETCIPLLFVLGKNSNKFFQLLLQPPSFFNNSAAFFQKLWTLQSKIFRKSFTVINGLPFNFQICFNATTQPPTCCQYITGLKHRHNNRSQLQIVTPQYIFGLLPILDRKTTQKAPAAWWIQTWDILMTVPLIHCAPQSPSLLA